MAAPLSLRDAPSAFTSSLIFIPYSYLEIVGHWFNIMDIEHFIICFKSKVYQVKIPLLYNFAICHAFVTSI
jgi:hypothetical protein